MKYFRFGILVFRLFKKYLPGPIYCMQLFGLIIIQDFNSHKEFSHRLSNRSSSMSIYQQKKFFYALIYFI